MFKKWDTEVWTGYFWGSWWSVWPNRYVLLLATRPRRKLKIVIQRHQKIIANDTYEMCRFFF